jgi:hypothetical protein
MQNRFSQIPGAILVLVAAFAFLAMAPDLAASSDSPPLPADRPMLDFPENAEFRLADFPIFITARTADLRQAPPLFRSNG